METINGNIGNCCTCGGCACQQKQTESSESKQVEPAYCNTQPFPFVDVVSDVPRNNSKESGQTVEIKKNTTNVEPREQTQKIKEEKKTEAIAKVLVPEIELRFIRPATIQTDKKLNSSYAAAEMFREIIGVENMSIREYSIAFYLNNRLRPIGYQLLSMGGIDGTVVDIRIIFSVALRCLATGIIIAHNHPTGGLKPSEQDISITKKTEDAGKILSIRLLDHIIVTTDNHYSLSDNGLLGVEENEFNGLNVTIDKPEEMGGDELSGFRAEAREFLKND